MEFSAKEIAALIDGIIEGSESVKVTSLAKIEEAQPGTLTFLANPKYTEFIYDTNASIAIVATSFVAEKPLPENLTLIKLQDPYAGFAKLLAAYEQMMDNEVGISKLAAIHPNAKIGEGVYISDFVKVEDGAVIGDNTRIYSNVSIGKNVSIGQNCKIQDGVRIYNNSVIGNDCIIHSNTVIGSDGFGFAPNSANNYQKVPQIGNVIIEDHVEIGSGTMIDRATLGSTVIRKGVKLDNLIQVAHNVEIGENTVIAAQTGIAGSSKIGKNCMIGGQVGIAGHLKIGDGVKIAAQSGIGSNIKDNEIVQGSPAIPIGEFKRAYVYFKNLPKLNDEIRTIQNNFKTKFQNID